jgi:hypothetical protein
MGIMRNKKMEYHARILLFLTNVTNVEIIFTILTLRYAPLALRRTPLKAVLFA